MIDICPYFSQSIDNENNWLINNINNSHWPVIKITVICSFNVPVYMYVHTGVHAVVGAKRCVNLWAYLRAREFCARRKLRFSPASQIWLQHSIAFHPRKQSFLTGGRCDTPCPIWLDKRPQDSQWHTLTPRYLLSCFSSFFLGAFTLVQRECERLYPPCFPCCL